MVLSLLCCLLVLSRAAHLSLNQGDKNLVPLSADNLSEEPGQNSQALAAPTAAPTPTAPKSFFIRDDETTFCVDITVPIPAGPIPLTLSIAGAYTVLTAGENVGFMARVGMVKKGDILNAYLGGATKRTYVKFSGAALLGINMGIGPSATLSLEGSIEFELFIRPDEPLHLDGELSDILDSAILSATKDVVKGQMKNDRRVGTSSENKLNKLVEAAKKASLGNDADDETARSASRERMLEGFTHVTQLFYNKLRAVCIEKLIERRDSRNIIENVESYELCAKTEFRALTMARKYHAVNTYPKCSELTKRSDESVEEYEAKKIMCHMIKHGLVLGDDERETWLLIHNTKNIGPSMRALFPLFYPKASREEEEVIAFYDEFMNMRGFIDCGENNERIGNCEFKIDVRYLDCMTIWVSIIDGHSLLQLQSGIAHDQSSGKRVGSVTITGAIALSFGTSPEKYCIPSGLQVKALVATSKKAELKLTESNLPDLIWNEARVSTVLLIKYGQLFDVGYTYTKRNSERPAEHALSISLRIPVASPALHAAFQGPIFKFADTVTDEVFSSKHIMEAFRLAMQWQLCGGKAVEDTRELDDPLAPTPSPTPPPSFASFWNRVWSKIKKAGVNYMQMLKKVFQLLKASASMLLAMGWAEFVKFGVDKIMETAIVNQFLNIANNFLKGSAGIELDFGGGILGDAYINVFFERTSTTCQLKLGSSVRHELNMRANGLGLSFVRDSKIMYHIINMEHGKSVLDHYRARYPSWSQIKVALQGVKAFMESSNKTAGLEKLVKSMKEAQDTPDTTNENPGLGRELQSCLDDEMGDDVDEETQFKKNLCMVETEEFRNNRRRTILPTRGGRPVV